MGYQKGDGRIVLGGQVFGHGGFSRDKSEAHNFGAS